MQEIADGDLQDAQPVDGAVLDVDGGGLLEIFRRAGDLGDLVALVADLGDNLVVEDEIIRQHVEVDAPQHLARIGPIAGMVFRQLVAHQQVLEEGEAAVGDILVDRHASFQRALTQNTGGEDHLINPVGDEVDHRLQEERRVLVVGMEHHDDVRPDLERLVVAGLLVAAVAFVLIVLDDIFDAQLLGHLDRVVAAAVVDQDDVVDDVERDLVVSLFQRLLRVVGGKDDGYFQVLYHDVFLLFISEFGLCLLPLEPEQVGIRVL